MKSKLILSLAFGFFILSATTNTLQAHDAAQADDESNAKAIATEVLTSHGFKPDEIQEILKNPTDSRGSAVCTYCIQIEKLLGDSNTNCGNSNYAHTCGLYLTVTVYNFLKSNKSACTQAVTNAKTICTESPTFGKLAGLVCPGFKCSTK